MIVSREYKSDVEYCGMPAIVCDMDHVLYRNGLIVDITKHYSRKENGRKILKGSYPKLETILLRCERGTMQWQEGLLQGLSYFGSITKRLDEATLREITLGYLQNNPEKIRSFAHELPKIAEECGCEIAIVSASPHAIVESFAAHIGIPEENAFGTKYEKVTRMLLAPLHTEDKKKSVVLDYFKKNKIDSSSSIMIGNPGDPTSLTPASIVIDLTSSSKPGLSPRIETRVKGKPPEDITEEQIAPWIREYLAGFKPKN